MMLLAQSAPPAGLGSWLESATYLVVLVTSVVVLVKQFKKEPPTETEIKGQPITVRADTRYATREDHEALEARVEARFAALDKSRRENVDKLHGKIDELAKHNAAANEALRREVKADTEIIFNKINEVATDVAAMSGALSVLSKNSTHPFSRT